MANFKIMKDTQQKAIPESNKTMENKKMENRPENFDEKLGRLISQIEGQLKDVDARFDSVQDQLKVVHTKLEYAINTTSATTSKFELIGSRYFYIEHDISQNWTTAAITCRQIGGHLASFKDQEELDAIAMKLYSRHGCWLGVNDHTKNDTFVSLSSGSPAFLKWEYLEPYRTNDNPHCVDLVGGRNVFRMVPCRIEMNFICQADDKV